MRGANVPGMFTCSFELIQNQRLHKLVSSYIFLNAFLLVRKPFQCILRPQGKLFRAFMKLTTMGPNQTGLLAVSVTRSHYYSDAISKLRGMLTNLFSGSSLTSEQSLFCHRLMCCVSTLVCHANKFSSILSDRVISQIILELYADYSQLH